MRAGGGREERHCDIAYAKSVDEGLAGCYVAADSNGVRSYIHNRSIFSNDDIILIHAKLHSELSYEARGDGIHRGPA